MGNERKGRKLIGNFIKNVVLVTAALIISLIASAYVMYFVGMTLSLAAGAILGLAGLEIAQLFAWIGVGATVYIFVKLVEKGIDMSGNDAVEISDEEFAKIFEEVIEKTKKE